MRGVTVRLPSHHSQNHHNAVLETTTMTFTFTPQDRSDAEIVHVATFGDGKVNYSDTLESYKLEQAQKAHYRRVRAMRNVGFGARFSHCG